MSDLKLEGFEELAMRFPDHKCGLYLEHNANRDYRESVEDYLDDQGERFQFQSDDHRARCIQSK